MIAPVLSGYRLPEQKKVNNIQFGFIRYPRYPKADKAIFVSGSSERVEDIPALSPYTDTIRLAIGHLAQDAPNLNYKVITGGYPGIGQAAKEGANGNSYIVAVKGWPKIPNQKLPNNKFLYKQLRSQSSGLRRTDKMIQSTHAVIVAPGGIGTLEELSAILEAMYYKAKYNNKDEAAPKKIILLDGPMSKGGQQNFWAPLLRLFDNMANFGVSNGTMRTKTEGNDYVSVVNVENPEEAAKDIVKIITGQRPETLNSTP